MKFKSFSSKLVSYFFDNFYTNRKFYSEGLVYVDAISGKHGYNAAKSLDKRKISFRVNTNKDISTNENFRKGFNNKIKKTNHRRNKETDETFKNYSKVWRLNDGISYASKEVSLDVLLDDYDEARVRRFRKYGEVYVDGKNSKFLGRHPYRIRIRPQNFFKPNLDFVTDMNRIMVKGSKKWF